MAKELEMSITQARSRWLESPEGVRRHVSGIARLLRDPGVFAEGMRSIGADMPIGLDDLVITPLEPFGSVSCPLYAVHLASPVTIREAQLTLRAQPLSGFELATDGADSRFAALNGCLTTVKHAPYIQGLHVVDIRNSIQFPILTVLKDVETGRFVPLHAKRARVTPDFGAIFLGVAGFTTNLHQPWGGFLVAQKVTRLKRR